MDIKNWLDEKLSGPVLARTQVRLKRGEKAGSMKWYGDLESAKGFRWESDAELRKRFQDRLSNQS